MTSSFSSPPQVLLLAAGKSSRTWPITDKIFVKFLGKTILQHQIENILLSSFSEIHIVGNTENISRIQEICTKVKQHFSCTFSFSVQKNQEDGQRGGILSAEKNINLKKPLLVMCSNDIVENTVLQKVVQKASSSSSEIFLVGKNVDKYFPGGYIQTNEAGKIIRIVEKPKPGTEPSNTVSLFIHFYKTPSQLFQSLIQYSSGDHYEEALQTLFDTNISAEMIPYTGFWKPIKYPWHFLSLNEYFLKKISKTYIHPSVTLPKFFSHSGNIHICEGVRFFDFSATSGNVYIGKNSTIAHHTLLRDSHIGEECTIGHKTEVARSIVGDNCWTHNNFIGDSVLQENISFGSGTQIGNLRFDEEEIHSLIKEEKINTHQKKIGAFFGENIRTGINTNIMPGIKIGKNSILGGGGVYCSDIPEKSFLFSLPTPFKKRNKKIPHVR